MKLFPVISEYIKKSVIDHNGKASHTRISSYIVLAAIMMNSIAFMFLEIVNAIIMWRQNLTYVVPTEHVWLFGLILSHHLGLLFYKQKEFKGANDFTAKSNLEDVKKGANSSAASTEEASSEESAQA